MKSSQRLMEKTPQYDDEAIADFRGRLTTGEWRNISDRGLNFQRKLCESISAKSQEAIRQQLNSILELSGRR
jgi:hypothetical protein